MINSTLTKESFIKILKDTFTQIYDKPEKGYVFYGYSLKEIEYIENLITEGLKEMIEEINEKK